MTRVSVPPPGPRGVPGLRVARRDAIAGVVDVAECRSAILDGKPGEVEVNGQRRQLPVEQIDGRAALERKRGFLRDFGQDAEQQANLC